MAAEYGLLDAARLLLDRGADVGGQTPVFHTLTNRNARNSKLGELLIARGADPGIIVTRC